MGGWLGKNVGSSQSSIKGEQKKRWPITIQK
jgi:hypothetical protein